MNDETRQMQEKLFDQIVLGLALIGLISALSALVISGYSSPWFFRALALIIVALVAFGLRRVSQFVIAAYVLIIELLGITTAILIQSNAFGFIPYLFIPIIVVAGLLLSPVATTVVAVISIIIVLVVAALTQQFSLEVFIALLPSFSFIMITALLVIEGKRYVEKLNDRLIESRSLLRERTLEMMEAQDTIVELQNKAQELKQDLLSSQGDVRHVEELAQQKNEGLYDLIKGSIQELDTSVEDLERLIDNIGEDVTPEEQSSSLEKAWQKIYHLNNLVINLEDMAQLKNEQVTLNYQDVDVAQLLRDIVGTTRGLARGKNLEIRCQVPDDLPKIPLDPVRIRQALLYILNNAIKYTDQGIIEVQAEMNTKELLIFVSDTGIGMHREEMERVFQEFARGSGTLAQQRQGTGLGLAISKALIELHNGHMWVTSVLGVGSTFYINLPLERPVVEMPTAVAVSMTEPEPDATIASVPTPTIPAFVNKEETALSTPPPDKKTQPAFGSPVGRFSPTYIGRLVFIALSVLIVIASIVAVLAAFYGPTAEEEIAATASVSPTSIAAIVEPENTPTGENVVRVSTNTPISQATPTDTRQPTETATPIDTPTPPPTETATPVIQATATETETETETPPSPTPTDAPVSTATPVATNAVQTTTVISDSDVQQASTRRPAEGLAVIANGLMGLHTMGNGSSSNANALGAIVPESNVSWSPGGDRVLFTSARDGNYEIYVADKDGREITNLTNANGYDTHPSWSPNGRSIAFSSQRGGNVDIYAMNTDGSNVQQLTTDRGYEEWPVWSPDGRKIAFISDRDGNNEIYVMNADGSNQQRITDNPADDWPAAWSPDGRKLVFSSNRDGNWNLYIIDITGGEAQQLTNGPADERDPIWSPDGSIIAFVTNIGGNWDVFTLPAPTGSVSVIPSNRWTQFTNTPNINERYPAWIP